MPASIVAGNQNSVTNAQVGRGHLVDLHDTVNVLSDILTLRGDGGRIGPDTISRTNCSCDDLLRPWSGAGRSSRPSKPSQGQSRDCKKNRESSHVGTHKTLLGHTGFGSSAKAKHDGREQGTDIRPAGRGQVQRHRYAGTGTGTNNHGTPLSNICSIEQMFSF